MTLQEYSDFMNDLINAFGFTLVFFLMILIALVGTLFIARLIFDMLTFDTKSEGDSK